MSEFDMRKFIYTSLAFLFVLGCMTNVMAETEQETAARVALEVPRDLGRDERAARVVGNRVLVERDPGLVE